MNIQNSEYRNRKSQMPTDENITRAILSDTKAFTPPAIAKVEIMKSLNFATGTSGFTGGSAGSILTLAKKSAIPIAAGIAIYFAAIYNHNESTNVATQAKSVAPIENVQSSNPANQSLSNNVAVSSPTGSNSLATVPMPSSKSSDLATISKKKVSPFSSNSPNNTIAPTTATAIDNEKIDQTSNEFAAVNTENRSAPRLSLAYSNISVNSKVNLSSDLSYGANYRSLSPMELGNNSNKKGFTLSVRGLASSSFADNYNFSSSLANSFAIGVYSALSGSDQFSIGVEAGCEPFQKKYFDKYTPNQISYIDNPNTIWGAIGMRMKLSDMDFAGMTLRPYASVLLGAGAIGPMGRVAFGIDQNLGSNVSAFVAAEAATMLYNNRVNWYTSNKFGLTFGLNYKF